MTELLEEKGLKVLIVTLPPRISGFTCIVQRGDGKRGLPVGRGQMIGTPWSAAG